MMSRSTSRINVDPSITSVIVGAAAVGNPPVAVCHTCRVSGQPHSRRESGRFNGRQRSWTLGRTTPGPAVVPSGYNTNLVGRQPSQRPKAPFVNPIRYERLPDLHANQNGDAIKNSMSPTGRTQLKRRSPADTTSANGRIRRTWSILTLAKIWHRRHRWPKSRARMTTLLLELPAPNC